MHIYFHIYAAAKSAFRKRGLRFIFVLGTLALFAGMFIIPVVLIPGNSVSLHADLLQPADYVVLAGLSLASSLLVIIQINIFQKTRRKQIHGDTAVGGIGVLVGLFSSLFASATCALCVGALFSFLGFGTVLFFAQHRWYIIVFAGLLLFISLYFSSRRLNTGCSTCSV